MASEKGPASEVWTRMPGSAPGSPGQWQHLAQPLGVLAPTL